MALLKALTSRRGWRRLALLAVLNLLAAVSAEAEGAFVSKEYQIKAAFLYNFTKFIEWPPQAFADASSPIVLGVSCPNGIDSELEQIVKDRKVNGRPLVVRRIAAATEARSLHLLFLCADEDARFEAIKAAAQDQALVTVGETPDFHALGGMITFVLEDDKIRFEINADAADRAGVRISAQLQKLAVQRTH